MFRRIMVPVDLAHASRVEIALAAAADLARHDEAEVVVVGATGSEPSAVARNPQDFSAKLDAFARATAERLGIARASADMIHLHDVTVELERALIAKARAIGADLVVMSSHPPGGLEHLIGSHSSYVAAHAPMSVLVVRR